MDEGMSREAEPLQESLLEDNYLRHLQRRELLHSCRMPRAKCLVRKDSLPDELVEALLGANRGHPLLVVDGR